MPAEGCRGAGKNFLHAPPPKKVDPDFRTEGIGFKDKFDNHLKPLFKDKFKDKAVAGKASRATVTAMYIYIYIY